MDVKLLPLIYLAGAEGTVDASYSATDASLSAVNRSRFRHHTFQRVKKTGESGNPVFTVQVALVQNPEAEDWSTVGTLDDTTGILHFHHVCWPLVRVVRSGGTTVKAKCLVVSSNTPVDSL